MPRIYLSRNWEEPTHTTEVEDVSAPIGICWWRMADVSADIQQVVEPKFQATRDLFVPTTSPEWTYEGERSPQGPPADYFGGAYDSTLPARPDGRSYTFSYRSPSTKRTKKFKDLISQGEILVGDRLVYDFKIDAQAGFQLPTGAVPVASLLVSRRQNGAFPLTPRVRCSESGGLPYGIAFPSTFPAATSGTGNGGLPILNNVYQRCDVYDVPAGSHWAAPTVDEAAAFAARIEAAISAQDVSTGLVTLALADANQRGLDILTTLGEAPETIRFIHDVLKQIVKLTDLKLESLKQIRRDFYKAMQLLGRQAVNPKAFLDKAASVWLQWRYAVMPLVYTVQDALDALSAVPHVYASSRKRQEWDLELDAPTGYNITVQGSVAHRCFIKRRYDLSIAGAEVRQIIVADVPTTLWELTRLSFVVDWALNVGDFIASLNSPPGVVQERALYSRQFSGSVVMTKSGCPGWELRADVRLYKAAVINPSDHNGLDLYLRVNWKRQLDAIALAWALFRSGRTSRA